MSSDTPATSILRELSGYEAALAQGDSIARLKVLELTQKLQVELATPGEALFKLVWAQPMHLLALRMALDYDVFNTLSADQEKPKSSEQLAAATNVDPILVGRFMRHLAAMGTVAETGPDSFAHNQHSRFFLTPEAAATVRLMFDWQSIYIRVPQYLAQHHHVSPTDPLDGPFQFAHNTVGTSIFQYFTQNPKEADMFGNMMRAKGQGKRTWSDGQLYPVKERVKSVTEPEGVLIVDLGGGKGHDLEWFRKNHPDLKGRLILQDLPYVIEKVQLDGIEAMVHDFNEEQPIKGAQIYFFHQVIHDYSDEVCRKMLRAVVPAMTPGYSRLLLNELILPDQGAHWFTTGLDLELMMSISARQRTETQFKELIASVGGGLRIEKIYKPEANGMLDSLIECVIDP